MFFNKHIFGLCFLGEKKLLILWSGTVVPETPKNDGGFFRTVAPGEGEDLTPVRPEHNRTDPGKEEPIGDIVKRERAKRPAHITAPLVHVTVHEPGISFSIN